VETAELLRLNLAIEPDLQNFVGFLMESVRRLKGNAFQAALASLELNRRLRIAGACCGQPFTISIHLHHDWLHVHWGENQLAVTKAATTESSVIDQLRDYLHKATESVDPEILIQRNEAMARHLQETRERTERELAELQVKLLSRQAELQASLLKAETDPLTALPNRRAFDAKLDQAFRHTMRQKSSPLSLVMLDLDYFKSVNDEHGHLFGDAYLNKMAHILRSVIREDVDCAFRFGGDEFAMMIYSDYRTACDKARQVLQQMGGQVSIGIATIDQNTPTNITLEDFIHKADSALYEAKSRGRGRAVVGQCSKGDTNACGSACAMKEPCV
jgi:diguanylate cyclase (GGDEF)-like protein